MIILYFPQRSKEEKKSFTLCPRPSWDAVKNSQITHDGCCFYFCSFNIAMITGRNSIVPSTKSKSLDVRGMKYAAAKKRKSIIKILLRSQKITFTIDRPFLQVIVTFFKDTLCIVGSSFSSITPTEGMGGPT